MRNEVAIKVLRDICPAADNHVSQALKRAISSLQADRTLTVIVKHEMPPLPSIGDMLKGMQGMNPGGGNSLKAFDMFSKGNLDKLFGGESDGV